MLQIDVKTDSARLVQTPANGQDSSQAVRGRCTKFQNLQKVLAAHIGANWARNARDRRSTSREVLMHGSRQIKRWIRRNRSWCHLRLSPTCTPWVKVSAEAMGFQSVMRDLGQSWSTVVCSDAWAASVVVQRQRLGRLTCIAICYSFRA